MTKEKLPLFGISLPIVMSICMGILLVFFLGEYRIFPGDFTSIYISVSILTFVTLLITFLAKSLDKEKNRTAEQEIAELKLEEAKSLLDKVKRENKILKRKIETMNSANNKSYTLIFSLENRLRKFAEEKMKEKWGDQWIQKIDQNISKRCKEYKEKCKGSQRLHSYDPCLSLISYASLHELGEIITAQNNWDHIFQKLFPRQNKDIIKGQIETLVPFRDNVAHNRPITPKDLTTVEHTCKIIDQLIK